MQRLFFFLVLCTLFGVAPVMAQSNMDNIINEEVKDNRSCAMAASVVPAHLLPGLNLFGTSEAAGLAQKPPRKYPESVWLYRKVFTRIDRPEVA